jgi:hypothetical protein
MDADNRIGLLGIGAWLLGVIFIAMGLAGVFDAAQAADGPQCTTVYPRGFKVPKVSKASPTCSGGDLQATWRICTPRYNA